MRKRRRRAIEAPSMPSPKQQMRWSAESMAESALRNHPKMKQMRDHITEAVVKATEHAMKKTMMGKARHADEAM